MRFLARYLCLCGLALATSGVFLVYAQTAAQPRSMVQSSHSMVNSVAFSLDGRTVLTGSDDNLAQLWDTATGKKLWRFEGHTGPVNSAAISPDGRQVLTGGWYRTVQVWDTASGMELLRFDGHGLDVSSVAFSPDVHSVLSGSVDGTARLWNAESGKELWRFETTTR